MHADFVRSLFIKASHSTYKGQKIYYLTGLININSLIFFRSLDQCETEKSVCASLLQYTARNRCKVLSMRYVYYFRAYQRKVKGLYVALESLISCISPFLRQLRNQ